MCFTIEIHLTRRAIEKRFPVDASALYDFDFNYFYRAFDHPLIPVVTQEEPEKVQLMEWGLIPAWAGNRDQAGRIRKGTFNARAESLSEKPSFRGPFKKGRCWIIAHGFFEWQQQVQGKIPWYIRLKNDKPFVFAGLYDRWRDPDDGSVLPTCAIITTRANPLLEKIHNTKKRMPVILHSDTESEWIGSDLSPERSGQLFLPFPEDQLHAHPVSKKLIRAETSPGDPDIIRPFDHTSPGKLF